MPEVGDIARIARESANDPATGRPMSMEALARISGVSKNTILNTEMGHRKPNGSTLTAIARALGFDTWEDVLAKYAGTGPAPNGHGDLIPVLATIPAGFDSSGEVQDAYNHVEEIDYMPGGFRDASDPRMFGLIVEGDSMAPDLPDGCYVTCSAKHWFDHGFIDGERYAIQLPNGDTTIKRVRFIRDGQQIELVPSNRAHPTKTINSADVKIAALVRGTYTPFPMPSSTQGLEIARSALSGAQPRQQSPRKTQDSGSTGT